jgi:diguanylate cyclase (GGDEF)-like protein
MGTGIRHSHEATLGADAVDVGAALNVPAATDGWPRRHEAGFPIDMADATPRLEARLFQPDGAVRVSKPGVVIVVDDDASLRRLVVAWLHSAGLATLEAETGEAALALAAANLDRVDAMVLDVMLPAMNGYEVLVRMQRNPATDMVPVVLLSAEATADVDIVHGMDTGAVDYLRKPFSGPVLVSKVRAACHRSQCERRMRHQLASAESDATMDALTKLHNRRHFDIRLAHESAEAVLHSQCYSLLIIDLDHFKAVNDTFGHKEGDRVLSHVAGVIKRVAAAVKQVARSTDTAFRYGGEEFAILLTGCDEQDAIGAGERIAESLRDNPIRLGDTARVITFSGGVASAHERNGFNGQCVVERADAALYRAKSCGRNRVLGESSP